MTWILVSFLVAHGFVHVGVWLSPRRAADADVEAPMPFAPDHSGVLSGAHVSDRITHAIASLLAVASAVGFAAAGFGVATDATWTADAAAAAAVVGLLLKGLYFNPWLVLGVALDLFVLSMALYGWPVALG